jgi:hypothetical protein
MEKRANEAGRRQAKWHRSEVGDNRNGPEPPMVLLCSFMLAPTCTTSAPFTMAPKHMNQILK